MFSSPLSERRADNQAYDVCFIPNPGRPKADDSLPDHGIRYQATKLIYLPITQTYPP